MQFGRIVYRTEALSGRGLSSIALKLTLIGVEDAAILAQKGMRELRMTRILRLTSEADAQGCLLAYEDLSALLVTSLATLKRDIVELRRRGQTVRLKGMRANGGCITGPKKGTVTAGGDAR